MHWMVLESFRLCSLCQYFDFLSVFQRAADLWTVSMAETGVLRMEPVIMLMAWCCTLDSLLEIDFAALELAAISYSLDEVSLHRAFSTRSALINAPLCARQFLHQG